MVIDAYDKNADVVNFMNVQGALVSPTHEASPLRLARTGPSRRGNYVLNFKYQMANGTPARCGTLEIAVPAAFDHASLARLETPSSTAYGLARPTGRKPAAGEAKKRVRQDLEKDQQE